MGGRQQAGHGSGLPPRGRGRLPVIHGVNIRLAHGLPGKPGEKSPPPRLINYHSKDTSDQKIRAISS